MARAITKEKVAEYSRVDIRGVSFVLQGYLQYLLQPHESRIILPLSGGVNRVLDTLEISRNLNPTIPLSITWTNLETPEDKFVSKFEISTRFGWVARLLAMWDISRGYTPNNYKGNGIYASDFSGVSGSAKGLVYFVKKIFKQHSSQKPLDMSRIDMVADDITNIELYAFQTQTAFRIALLNGLVGTDSIQLTQLQMQTLNLYGINQGAYPRVTLVDEGEQKKIVLANGEKPDVVQLWSEYGRGVRPYAMNDEYWRSNRMRGYYTIWNTLPEEYSFSVRSKFLVGNDNE